MTRKLPFIFPIIPNQSSSIVLGSFCWVCVIFFARVVVSECMRRARRGGQRGRAPRARVRGQCPRKFFFCLGKRDTYLGKRVMYLGGFFGTWFLPMVFYFRLRNQDFGLIQFIGLGFWMSMAPICILYCKQCNTMNEYNICWFSRFGFPGEKSLCNVCICHCIFSVLF